MTVNVSCNNLTVSTMDSGVTMTLAGTNLRTLSVFGNITLPSARFVWSHTGTLALAKSGGTQTLATNGSTIGALTLTAAAGGQTIATSGNVDLAGSLTTNGGVTINLTGGNLTMNSLSFDRGNTLNFGSGSTLFLTGNNKAVYSSQRGTVYVGPIRIVSTYTGAVGTRSFLLSQFETLLDVFTGSGIGLSIGTAATDTVSFVSAVNNLDLTGYSGSLAIGDEFFQLFGNLTMGTSTNSVESGELNFASPSSSTLTTNNRTFNFRLKSATTLQLVGNLNMGSAVTFTVDSGAFFANNYNVTVGRFRSSNSNGRSITMGSGTWTLTGVTRDYPIDGTHQMWDLGNSTNLVLFKDTANIVINGSAVGTRNFNGGSLSYNRLTIADIPAESSVRITGSNSFTHIISSVVDKAYSLLFSPGSTQTVSTAFDVSGTSTAKITIDSSPSTGQHFLTKTGGGEIEVRNTRIANSHASPVDTWNAKTSKNLGNNTNWTFGGGAGFLILLT
jgi:hypothetical protein